MKIISYFFIILILLLILYRIMFNKKFGLIGQIFSLSSIKEKIKIENILVDFLILEVIIIYMLARFNFFSMELNFIIVILMSIVNQLAIFIYKKHSNRLN